MDFKKTFAARLRWARRSLKWTQRELGGKAGLTAEWISHFEGGRRQPNLTNLVALCDALGVSADYLIGRIAHEGEFKAWPKWKRDVANEIVAEFMRNTSRSGGSNG